MKIKCSVLLFPLLIILSCSNQEQRPAFYDPDSTTLDSIPLGQTHDQSQPTNNSENVIIVPFKEYNGIKQAKASVNGCNLYTAFNTECVGSLISVDEANYLYQKGYLKKEDVKGTPSQMEGGAIVENMAVNLRAVVIDGKISFNNVNVTVSASEDAPLLLCKDAIDQIASYVINNERKEICFKLK